MDVAARAGTQRWIHSRQGDLLAFGGSALAAGALVAIGYAAGWTSRPLPTWMWLALVLLVDVAHVWSTLFRVYFDRAEVTRRPWLYLATPVAVYALGVALHSRGSGVFWTALAYVAVFHFVRQQYGWVALYKRRNADNEALDNWLDALAVYNATLFPLLWWHAHLPREFHWFMPDDFVPGFSSRIVDALHPVHFAILAAWGARQIHRWSTRRELNVGKCVVIVTTWACWYGGIVAANSDYVFTVTNVIIHGVPYTALVWRYARNRYAGEPGWTARIVARGAIAFVAVTALFALGEEGAWDHLVWHDHAALFGDFHLELSGRALAWVVPLLAVPQATHYVLDAWIWRIGARNPQLAQRLGFTRAGLR